MAVRYYSQAVVDKVNMILMSGAGPITKWSNVLDVLFQEKIAYTVDEVHTDYFLVHPDNRSKLGINAFNSHRQGAYIIRVGADLQLLATSTAFELSGLEPARSDQLRFNHKLVDKADAMLAVTGKEWYLTVSCGHTTAFCRAGNASCKTTELDLQDSFGRLNAQSLGRTDAAMRHMLTKGWRWTILPWQCECTWPCLPHLAQSALNASHGVASQATELEVAASIATFAAQAGGSVAFSTCVDAATASLLPCLPYIKCIGEYVRLYAGGAGVPLIHYLDDFAKTFGESKRLGQDFIQAVTDISWGLHKPNLHVRTALLAANLISPRVVDGVARLLCKSDVEKLRQKERLAAIGLGKNVACSTLKFVSLEKYGNLERLNLALETFEILKS